MACCGSGKEKVVAKTKIDPVQILNTCLAEAIGLTDYCWIRRNLDKCATDEFRARYSSFFRLRREESWKGKYFRYLGNARREGCDFASTLQYLYGLEGKVEASFASKLVAVIDPSKPIWDSIVLRYFGLAPKATTPTAKLDEALGLYAELQKRYAELLASESGLNAIAVFNKTFPEYAAEVSDIKKLDCFIWASGRNRR